jgi:hypothetical protein
MRAGSRIKARFLVATMQPTEKLFVITAVVARVRLATTVIYRTR